MIESELKSLPQNEICQCGKVKTPQNTSTKMRRNVGADTIVYYHICKDCRNKQFRMYYANRNNRLKIPQAPPGRAYCLKCWTTEGHMDINLFPNHINRGKTSRRHVCRYCMNDMRRRRDQDKKQRKIEESRQVSNQAHAIVVVPIPRIDHNDIKAIRNEGLDATLDANRPPRRDRRPIDLLRKVGNSDANLGDLYCHAWKSVRAIPRMLDSRIRGWITVSQP